ncbi:ComEA family DNA-binding protein [Streptomyces sp. H27-C3]|uniref:ComEA family DNA-binding protein n=1 Tax=Streptomyces sp. H27-C3 TaxID=3046305 RepID=UPI0024BA5E8C|nr:ComEA family DNA-binding protein [Streptomyces sp. H27-C3]MDJ0464540.1 ComEA family DNA-binding protein [Streptomyces sp. H27-C3]
MALRSHSATSGPGRAPASDVRTRHGHGRRRRLRRPDLETPAAMALRRRAEALFEADPSPAPGASTVGGASRSVLPAPSPEFREPGPPRRPSWARRPGAGPQAGGGDSASRGRGVPSAVPGPDAADARDDRSDVDPEAGAAAGVARGARLRMALRERLPVWVQSRCGLEPRSLAALVVVLVVAAIFAAQHFWAGRPDQVRPPERVGEGQSAVEPGPAPGLPPTAPTGASGSTGSSGPPGTRVVVDVSGKVRQPGVRRLPAGSRVADALRAAGGAKDGANTTGLNRARLLIDGEQVVVGASAPPSAPAAPGTVGAPVADGATGAGPITLSTATVEQLETLPGVGPVLAQHIVDYRTQHGGFRSIGELREVNGIGDRRFADIQPLVRP